MPSLSRGERAWIWVARLLGVGMLIYVTVILKGNVPTPLFVLIGGLLGAEFVYKEQRKGDR